MMKTGLLFLAGMIALAGCEENSSEEKKGSLPQIQEATNRTASSVDTANFTTIKWIDSIKQVGKINEGQKLVLTYRFINTGDKPLIIQSVMPGCGCTVAEKPEKPIAPGAEGEIRGEFNSDGRAGALHKSITVMANTKVTQAHNLQFEGEVIAAKK